MAFADREPLTGGEAAAVELINESVPFERLEARVAEIAAKLARIPLSQLQAQKLIVNQAYENMGLASTQTLGGILDGLMRNTPDALEFIDVAGDDGVRAAIERRDGPWGDYSQAPPERQPRPVARHRALIASAQSAKHRDDHAEHHQDATGGQRQVEPLVQAADGVTDHRIGDPPDLTGDPVEAGVEVAPRRLRCPPSPLPRPEARTRRGWRAPCPCCARRPARAARGRR